MESFGPSIGMFEWVLIGLIALIVVGPKDLPLMFRKLGRFVAKLRGMAEDFRATFDEMARQSELDELRKEVDSLRAQSRQVMRPLDGAFEPIDVMRPLPAPAPAPVADPPSSAEDVPAKDRPEQAA